MPQFHPLWPSIAPPWLHPHLLFESVAYAAGFALYRYNKLRMVDPVSDTTMRLWVVVAAILGAALGSKLLFLCEDPAATWGWLQALDVPRLMGGKTIVGGLLGGWVAVEWAKKRLGIKVSTGDLFVPGLILGMVIGRLGCFFAGIEDGTHGAVTDGILGMDLGDGLRRHPTVLYEIVFLLLMGLVLWRTPRNLLINGDRFLLFMGGYLAWRFFIEFLKPRPAVYGGLSAIQVVCFMGLLWILRRFLSRMSATNHRSPNDPSADLEIQS